MSEPYLGQIILFAGNFAIRGFAICEGQSLNISQNTALFSILGTTYGGDGESTFKLPDLRGRVALQQGQGPGIPGYSLGQQGGRPFHQITTAQMPNHTHQVRMPSNSEDGNSDDPENKFPAVKDSDQYSDTWNGVMGALTCSSVGGGQSFSIQNPFLAINFLIALTGIFPSQN